MKQMYRGIFTVYSIITYLQCEEGTTYRSGLKWQTHAEQAFHVKITCETLILSPHQTDFKINPSIQNFSLSCPLNPQSIQVRC